MVLAELWNYIVKDGISRHLYLQISFRFCTVLNISKLVSDGYYTNAVKDLLHFYCYNFWLAQHPLVQASWRVLVPDIQSDWSDNLTVVGLVLLKWKLGFIAISSDLYKTISRPFYLEHVDVHSEPM